MKKVSDPMKEACKWAIPSVAVCYAAFVIANPGADGLVLGSVLAAIVTLANLFMGKKLRESDGKEEALDRI